MLKLCAALGVALLVAACSSGPAAVDFDDPLTGPVSPSLAIPFEKYGLTANGLLRTSAESGTENGIERPMIRTLSGAYSARDFIFEVDVNIPATHGDIAYVGFGRGDGNPVVDNEPTRAFLFRIHNLPRIPHYSVDFTIADPEANANFRGQYRHFNRLATYTPGRPMRFQIAKRGDVVTMAIPGLPDAKASFDAGQYRGLFDDRSAYIFFGNSSEGTTFTNASLRHP